MWIGEDLASSRPLTPEDYPTAAALVEKWNQVEDHVRAFLSTLKDEDLGRKVEFALGGGPKHSMPLGELLHHATVHGVHHRGQVGLLLRSLGLAPGNVDILLYYGERQSPQVS